MVAYLERIPWAEVTHQMLSVPAGTPLAAVGTCGYLLYMLMLTAINAATGGEARFAVLMRLQTQVRGAHLVGENRKYALGRASRSVR